jgi:hypothetical protein
MMPIEEIWCLTDEQGRSLYINNGQVDQSAVPVPLEETPEGWIEKTIRYNRDSTYNGLFRTFTDPVKYVRNAALIIRDRIYRLGIEARIFQTIHRLDKSFGGGWVHRFFYRGELDLSQAIDDDNHVQVNIMEGDLSKFVKANENTQYDIDIDVPQAVFTEMDGLQLKQTASYLVLDQNTAPTNGNHTVPLQFINQEAVALNLKGVERTQLGGNSGSDQNNKMVNDTLWFHKSAVGANVSLEWDFYMTAELASGIPPNPAVRLFLVIRNLRADGSIVGQVTLNQFNGPLNSYRRNHFVGSATITGIEPGSALYAFMGINIIGSSGDRAVFFTYDNTEPFKFNITESFYRHRTTYIKGLRPAYVAQAILDKMTGGGYQFASTLLTTEWDNLLLTSGDAIRGFAGAKLSLSWSELFKSLNVPCNICSSQRNQILYIEKKDIAYQPTTLLNLGEGSSLTINQAKDYQYNRVQVGYPNTDTEDINGRDEFNVTQLWTSNVTKGSNKMLDLVSVVKASMYEIELARINLDGKVSTDDQVDKTPYFLHVEKNSQAGGAGQPPTYYKLLRKQYGTFTGVISPATAFNVELHPELCLRRHSNYLASIFYHVRSSTLNFEKSDKNGNVLIIDNGFTVVGEKKIPVAKFGAPMFLPWVFNLTSPMADNVISVMDAGPDGTFEFTYDGVPLFGFPLEVSIQPVGSPSQETVMLCSPKTDVLKLITLSR